MKTLSGKRFIRILKRKGWTLKRVKGSHHIYGHSESDVLMSIPVHGNKDLKAGLQRHFMSLAGIEESDL